jgi:hypothetical protein
MPRLLSVLLTLQLVVLGPSTSLAETMPPSPPSLPEPSTATLPAEDGSYRLFSFVPSYRGVSTSGYAGRVGEYDSLRDSAGGELKLTLINAGGRVNWQTHANLQSVDEYDLTSTLAIGRDFTMRVDSRSLRHHLDNVPFGTNLSPDDIARTDDIAAGALFGVKRTQTDLSARLRVSGTPLTVFAKAGWQDRTGQNQLQYYDMGGDEQCGSCHSASRYRPLESLTRNYVAGVEAKFKRGSLSYEHTYRSFEERQAQPIDAYGATLAVEEDPLPEGVPNTLPGNYLHNLVPSHHTNIDTLRLRLALSHASSFTGSISKGRTHNTDTGNPQNLLNADARLSVGVKKQKLRGSADYHRRELDNDFTPFYPLFGNPSLHRDLAGLRLDYTANPMLDLETHYRYGHVTRSNTDLWPQFYSPENADPRYVVPETTSHTLGISLLLHGSDKWQLHPGYDWIDTHAPGYLTVPGRAERVSLTASFAPDARFVLSDDFSALFESAFGDIQKQNHLYFNTAYATLLPVHAWSVAVGYSYFQNDLKTDLTYGMDPVYVEPLVPFKALSQGFNLSSSYSWKERLRASVQLGHITAHSEFRPTLDNEAFPVVAWAADFSRVDVPQFGATATLDYRFQRGFSGGFRYRYGRYEDRVHPELDGRLQTYSLFVGKAW